MKKALILGTRICEVRSDTFPVHPDLHWQDVPDDTTTQDIFQNGQVVKYVTPVPPVFAPDPLDDLRDAMRSDPTILTKIKALNELF